jgi:hypothetical protein
MAGKTKLALSDYELQLVHNSDWILTKQQVMAKATELLAIAAENMKGAWDRHQYDTTLRLRAANSKISKGENYRQLPWVLLDYPRYFDKENVFAVRSFFWWGHFFSLTLQLSGTHKLFFQKALLQRLQENTGNDYFICINEDPWQHDFGESNYVLVSSVTGEALAQHIHGKAFIKLARKFPLEAWETIPVLLETAFEELLQLIRP